MRNPIAFIAFAALAALSATCCAAADGAWRRIDYPDYARRWPRGSGE